jgi:solute carrier family 50 protein (sugar transporter)
MENIQECFGWAGAFLSVCYFIAPFFPFIDVIRGKMDFEDSPGVFVTTCYVNCFIWYIYGDMIFSDQVKISNLIAACMCCLLIFIYLVFEIRKYLVDTILNTLILISGTWAVYRALTIIIDDDRTVGKICFGTTAVMYITPIQIIYKVLKEKHYKLIPLYPAWVYLFASIAWVVYGFLINDFYLICPNSAGIILSLIQIAIYLNYKKKYPTIGDKDFSSTIGIESTASEDEPKSVNSSIKLDEEESKGEPVKIVGK